MLSNHTGATNTVITTMPSQTLGWESAKKDPEYGRSAWRKARLACLRAAGWRCQRQLPGCQGQATEVNHRYMVLEAILSIQAGDNPRVLAEKLEAYLPPAKRGAAEKGAPAVAAVPDEERQAA